MSYKKEYLPRDAYNSPELQSQSTTSNHEKKRESLIDIVEAIISSANVNKDLRIYPIARVHCMYNGKGETFWFYNEKLASTYGFSEHRELGYFVPNYSDVAIKMQKGKIGSSFKYEIKNNLKRKQTYIVVLENRSDLQNQTIVIAGDDIHHQYQYRNIKDFLKALQQNQEDIKDIETEISDLNKLIEELSAVPNTASKRGQIKKTIKSLQEKYRILTQQQEDLENITIYIRKQGEMRYTHLVDPIQTRIMTDNRFDGKTIVINGCPGTGKTTTMIHRLSYLTDKFAIEEDEKNQLNNYKLNSQQRKQLLDAINNDQDWMFFSPSKLLKQYLAEAMIKEGLTKTSQKVWNWKDYCKKILQEYYHLLEMNGNNAPFKVFNKTDTLFYQNSDIINVFTQYYLDELRSIKMQLPELSSERKNSAWYIIAFNIKKRFEETEKYDFLHFITLFNALESAYGNDCKKYLRDRNDTLIELTKEICDLLNKHKEQKADIEDLFELISDEQNDMFEDEYNTENEEDNAADLVENMNNKVTTKSIDKHIFTEIQKWLKSFCYSKVNDKKELTSEQKIIAEILLPILGDEFEEKIQNIGDLMLFEQYAQYTRGVHTIMLKGIPARYKKFRTFLSKTKFEGCNLKLLRDIMQRKQGKELHHQEQSLLLGFINTLVKQIKGSTSANIRHNYIDAYEYVSRPIIGVDEVTDFSICDIYAMQSLLKREFNSFTLCGDMMQRMTSYGIQSWDVLNGIVANPKVVEMKTSYRQSVKLLEVARQLYKDTLRETPNYKSFMKFKRVPAPLAYVDDNEYAKLEWISKRISEVYRAYGERLPSIAIFLNDIGYIPRFIENLQNTEFFIKHEIRVLDGTNKNITEGDYICVYPIDQVKGMEFDVVFFHNIDNSSVDTDILKRYIYVGVSRAAFFLAITMNEEILEISKYFEKNKDWFNI